MRYVAILCAALISGAAQAQDAYGPTDTVWRLSTLDGEIMNADVTLTFPQPNRIAGRAPCNRYFGPVIGDYPAFRAPLIGASKMACPHLAGEDRFFAALGAVTTALRDDQRLILSDATGPRLIFTAAE